MMTRIETWFDQDLKKPVRVHYIDGNVFSQDNNGNVIGVNVFDNGVAVTLSGTVVASVIRADGATVVVSGTLSGNKASVVLPQAAYAVPGVLSVVIKVSNGSDVTTVCAVVGNVYMSSTDSIVDPGTILPSIETLIAEIEAAVASIPADYSSLWTSLAPAFSNSIAYTAGEYVTYNGGLYCFSTDHPAGTWDVSHVWQVSVGKEMTETKNSFSDDNDFFQRNVSLAGNLLPFYAARYDNTFLNDYRGRVMFGAFDEYVTYIIPVAKNTQYIFTHGRSVSLLKADRKTMVGPRHTNIYSVNSGEACYLALCFNKTTYPENTYVVNIRQTGDQETRNEQSVLEIDKLRLNAGQQKYLTTNIYQDPWELGDIRTTDGGNAPSSTSLRTAEYCPVYPSESYVIDVASIEHGQTVGYLYQYAKNLDFAGSGNVLTIKNGISFVTSSVTSFVRVVLTSAYGTTFHNDFMFYQPGGLVRNIMELLKAKMPSKSRMLVVSKFGDGDYTSLRHAVRFAQDGDTIFVRRGVYDGEIVEAWSKNLTIIGESPYNTIIQNDTDAYATPPLEMSVGAIYNLCFHAIAHESTKRAYALHIDNDYQENGTFYAENCIFISDDGPAAVGAGSRRNHRQVYKNCAFINQTNEPAFFGNEATNQQTAGVVNNQYYEFYDCVFKTPGAHQYVVIMRGMKAEGNTVWCIFKDCSFMDDGTTEHPVFRMDYTNSQYIGTATTMGNMGMVNWNLDPISSGNTIPELNTCPDGVIMRYGPIGS